MKTTPLQQVKDRFGDKAKLVEAVQALATDELWLARVSEAKGLGKVSNAKLIRLHAALSRVKEEFGSRAALITAVMKAAGAGKDAGYEQRLSGYPVPRLIDLHDTLVKSAARRSSQPERAAAPKKARSKRAKAKAKAAA